MELTVSEVSCVHVLAIDIYTSNLQATESVSLLQLYLTKIISVLSQQTQHFEYHAYIYTPCFGRLFRSSSGRNYNDIKGNIYRGGCFSQLGFSHQ